MSLDQIAIACTGVIAIWLSQDVRPQWRKWACIFGLCAQPFWFWTTYHAEQWGIFAMCFLYTWSWLKGFRNNWLITRTKP